MEFKAPSSDKKRWDMLKKERSYLTVLLCLIWFFLIAIGIWDLFEHALRSIIWFGIVISLIYIYFQLRTVPTHVHFLLAILATLNVFGELVFGFYYFYESYDKLLHIISSVVICIFVYHLVNGRIRDKKLLILFSVAAVISLGAIWEIFEFVLDRVLNSHMQGVNIESSLEDHFFGRRGPTLVLDQLNDTMIDMVCNIFGSLAFAAGYYFYSRRKTIHDINRRLR